MKALKARITKGLNHGTYIDTCDNSGAKIVRLISFRGAKTVKGRKPAGGVGDLAWCSVYDGEPSMKKTIFPCVIVRQKKAYRRMDGTRVVFEDNAVIILKDDKLGTPKGTIFKGPIAKEAADRWPGIAKVASIIV